MPQTLFFLVSLTKKSLPEHHPMFTPSYRRQHLGRRTLLPDLPINNINSITTMAPNASDDGQINTSIISIARSNPTALRVCCAAARLL